VLLLDEPGISLDPAWRQRLQTILHEEARRGKTVLVTTHLIGEWNNVAHRCLLCAMA
jgi:ABC-type multidrug transport system ATPase subunit